MCKFTLIFLFLDRTIKTAFVRADFIIRIVTPPHVRIEELEWSQWK